MRLRPHLSALLLAAPLLAQQPADEKPLPDIPTLMRQVEAHQRAADELRKRYTYRVLATQRELDGKGNAKKTETEEREVLFLEGVQVTRLLKKDGKELTDKERRKEEERVQKAVDKAKERKAKADAKDKDTDANGRDMITVSRILELGQFSNPRRILMDGRPTIVADYTGDPKAKTHNRGEEVIRDLVGTAYIDEQDQILRRGEGRFARNFKIGGGLVASIHEGSSFRFENTHVNDEIWLPRHVEGHGSIRVMLFMGFNGDISADFSGYRRFQATSTILPEVTRVPEDQAKPEQ
ncbi:hypothetical protein [Terriglobus tenax]|uniref:hypothetical protein n=1 Tax=Terriglobus tenax TaxID=1111115 RepID=UPI0021E0E4B6|nr:hypothetical protein [Terriglobus tenax]